MIPTDFIVEPANWAADMTELRSIRTEVFVNEQAVPEEEEWDDLDENSQHVIARSADGRPIGTGRLTPKGTIGRMAVLADWRGRGVGEAILRVLLEIARARHFKEITIHAQSHAVAFYERAGFEAYGEEFDECGILHRHMRIEIPAAEPPDRSPVPAHDDNLLTSVDRDTARAAVLAVIATARREVSIYMRELEADIYDHADVIEALKQVAISGSNSSIRILIQEPTGARADAHRLVALSQRLTSSFSFRSPIEEIDHQYPGCFVVSDRGAWFERSLASRFDGEGSTHGPGRKAQLQDMFNAIWERSVESAEMRRLEI
jgi:predicted GNAT family N-acyltransferase